MKRSKTATFALCLIIAMIATLIALPPTYGWNSATDAAVKAGMKWDFPGAENVDAPPARLLLWERWKDKVPTFMFVVPSPSVVGVGQSMSIQMYQPQVPPGSLAGNDVRYFGYQIEVTKPDGTTEKLGAPSSPLAGVKYEKGGFTSDPTGTTYTIYTPDQVGTYTVKGTFPQQTYLWYYDTSIDYGITPQVPNSTYLSFYGVTLLESIDTATFVVQDEPVQQLTWQLPLPTEYWERPIHSMNTEWYRISSNWLNGPRDRNFGGTNNRFQPDGTAPNTPHILWTKPLQDGGVIGGQRVGQTGNEFYSGTQYNLRASDPIVMHGRLYYQLPRGNSGEGGGWMVVDLRTGEEQAYYNWGVSGSGNPSPSFGYYQSVETMNQHGIVPNGLLFSNNFGVAYDPLTGERAFNLTNVPSTPTSSWGLYEFQGDHGEIYRYVFQNAGTTTNPNWRLLSWNSTAILLGNNLRARDYGTTIDASSMKPDTILPAPFYDWNVSAAWRGNLAGIVQVLGGMVGEVLIVRNTTQPGQYLDRPDIAYPKEMTITAVSIKKESAGNILWQKNVVSVDANQRTLMFRRIAEGVILFYWSPTITWVGYDVYTGEKLWESLSETDVNPYAYFGAATTYNQYSHSVAYGTLYTGGYLGGLIGYDLKTGERKFVSMFPTNMAIFEYYAAFIGAIADGKVFTGTHEHSAQTPLFKGHQLRAVNATTGEQVWTLTAWAPPDTQVVADGILAFLDLYDMKMNAVGRGPSETTISAPQEIQTLGKSLLLQGTVMDSAAGSKQAEVAARFPQGLPAVSDVSMREWMEYVYKQKPRPMNATGVPVTLSVYDPNGNYYDIGTVTSDTSGSYSLIWEPPVPGKYTIYASFPGSESYWPSHSQTALGVVEATPEPAQQQPQQNLPPFEIYIGAATAAIIIAIAIVGLLILKKK